MESWRDTASAEAQQALDDLFDTALELAVDQVTAQGGFLPFSLSVNADGENSIAMTHDLDSFQMIDQLWNGLREERDVLVAAAVVADVQLHEAGWSDGILVAAEHRDGIALEVVAPYKRRRLRRRVELGEIGLSPGEARVW